MIRRLLGAAAALGSIVVAGAIALILGACSETAPDPLTADAVRQAVATTAESGSARVDVSVTTEQGSEPTDVRMTGLISFSTGSVDLVIEEPENGDELRIVDGHKFARARSAGASGRWRPTGSLGIPAGGGDVVVGNSVLNMFQDLEEVSDGGVSDEYGVPCRSANTGISLALFASVDPAKRAQFERLPESRQRAMEGVMLPSRVCVDRYGRLIMFRIESDASTIAAGIGEEQPPAPFKWTMTMVYSDFGSGADILPPSEGEMITVPGDAAITDQEDLHRLVTSTRAAGSARFRLEALVSGHDWRIDASGQLSFSPLRLEGERGDFEMSRAWKVRMLDGRVHSTMPEDQDARYMWVAGPLGRGPWLTDPDGPWPLNVVNMATFPTAPALTLGWIETASPTPSSAADVDEVTEVNGVGCRQSGIRINLAAFASSLGPQALDGLPPQMQARLQGLEIPAVVCVDSQGRLLRARLTLAFSDLAEGIDLQDASNWHIRTVLTMDFSDFGVPVSTTVPDGEIMDVADLEAS